MTNNIVVIAGSREWTNKSAIVQWFSNNLNNLPWDVTIVTGGARGVDRLAHEEAQRRNLRTKVIEADWENLGKSAGYARNKTMVDIADKVVVFWDGRSKGSKHTIDLALKHKVPLEVYFG